MQNFNAQIKEFLDFIPKEVLIEIETKLRVKYPTTDDYWVQYWTARIAFFTNGETNFDFKLIGDYGITDPDTIQLSFDPDYGS